MRLILFAALMMFAAPAWAQAGMNGLCYSKDAIAEEIVDGTWKAAKLSGDDGERFRIAINKIYGDYQDPEGTTYVIMWRDGLPKAKAFIFDEHNCWSGSAATIPISLAAAFIGAES